MTDFGLGDRMTHLEQRVEELAKTMERCRQSMLLSKIAGVAGAIWLLAMMTGAVRFNGLGMIVSLSAILGGFVVFGSSRSTFLQAAAAMQATEAERTMLIGSLDLRTIDEAQAPRLLH